MAIFKYTEFKTKKHCKGTLSLELLINKYHNNKIKYISINNSKTKKKITILNEQLFILTM